MALPNTGPAQGSPDVSIPIMPPRSRPVDIRDADLSPQHYFEPEVNRLREWAMQANMEMIEENMLNAQVQALPPGLAIGVMVAASLSLWALIAAGVSLFF